jgi:hypothetical protein
MHIYTVHTLVDITENGNIKMTFPFKTLSGDMIHDKHSLSIARNQNNNFTTIIQLLQLRSNITWENPPKKKNDIIANTKFGTAYDGKQTSWHFTFFTEQEDVYGSKENNYVGQRVEDFNLVPIMSFCKETVTFPTNTFITEDDRTINTHFSYEGFENK